MPDSPTLPRRAPAVGLCLVLLAACAGRSTDPALRGDMADHYDRASDVQTGVILGDLDRARAAAERVAATPRPENLPSDSELYHVEMLRFAEEAAQGATLEAVASATADMARTCGGCHRRSGRGPRFYPGEPPSAPDVDAPPMTRHIWAADRLWEALIASSSASWASGVRSLRDAPLLPRDPSRTAERTNQAQAIQDRLRSLIEEGADAESPAGQARIYGRLLGTCADCHTLLIGES